MNVNRLYGVLIAVAIVAIAIPVYAQSSGTTKEEKAETDTVTGKQLEEVTVTADAKTVTVEGFKTTIQIAETAYDVAGSVIDLLPYLPGMTRTAGGLEVRGYGTPVYVIDGKKVTDMRQVSMLQVDRVIKVTIDTNPEMPYSAEAQAVVYITTRKTLYDTLSLKISGGTHFKRRFGWSGGPDLFVKLNKVTAQLGYTFSDFNSLLKETYFREIDRSGSGSSFSLSQPRKWFMDSRYHRIDWHLDWNISPVHTMTMYYFYNHTNGKDHIVGVNDIYIENQIKKSYGIDKNTNAPANTHNISLMYDGLWGKSRIMISQDVAFRSITSNQHTDEVDLMTDIPSVVDIDSRSKYRISTTRVDFSLPLPRKYYLQAGTYYKYIYGENQISSDNINLKIGEYNNIAKSHEHHCMGYIGLFHVFGRLTASAYGVYTYFFRSTTSRMDGETDKPVFERHSELYPKISVSFDCGRGFRLAGDYSQSRILPSYAEINSGLVYQDAYLFSSGNSDLRSSLKRDVRLSGSWNGVSAYVLYTKVHDPMLTVETPITEGSNIAKSWRTNMNDSELWGVSASYSRLIKCFNISVSGWIYFPNYKILEKNKTRHITTPYGGASLNLSYRFNNHFSVFTDYGFTSRRWSENGRWAPLHQWNLSINGSFLDNRFKVLLRFTDILNKEHYSNCSYFYDNVTWGTRGRSDQRGVHITVSYTLFNKEINTKAKNYNETELMRTSK